jgi:hypothetical protein
MDGYSLLLADSSMRFEEANHAFMFKRIPIHHTDLHMRANIVLRQSWQKAIKQKMAITLNMA